MENETAKGKILAAACDLFYNKGYNATSFEDIAAPCGITKQAITYHFESKAKLGKEVMHAYSIDMSATFENAVIEKYGIVENRIRQAAFVMWFSGLYSVDSKSLRFFEEFVSPNPDFDALAREEEPSYFSTFGLDENDLSLDTQVKMLTAFYAGKGLLHQHATGLLQCSDEQFARYIYLNYFEPFIDDRQVLEGIYSRAKEIVDGLHFSWTWKS